MSEYLVVWKIDIEADDAIDAAFKAHSIQTDGMSLANVFHVTDRRTKKLTVVDLDEVK